MASTIILSDNGASSGSAGVKTTGGNDGVLILQTTTSGGTATNAVYVDNSQRVGIGATPASWFTGYSVLTLNSAGNTLVGYSANDLGIVSGAYYNGGWKWAETNSLGASYYEQYNGNHYFNAAAPTSHTAGNAATMVQLMQFSQGNSVALEGATPKTGTGITFPATQSASSDANTLDDYEEGTWTPSVSFSTGTLSSYTVNNAIYTKIGNVVIAQADITINTGTGGAGNVVVASLPFTATANSCYAGVYGRERENTGKALSGLSIPSLSQCSVFFYDNSFPGANGNKLPITVIYRTT